MDQMLEEANGSVLAAIFVGIFLVFTISLFSGNSEVAQFLKAFLVTIGGVA